MSGAEAFLLAHAAPLAALAIALGGTLTRRQSAADDASAAIAAAAVLCGWSLLLGLDGLPRLLWAARSGVALLLAPAAGAVLARMLMVWRRGRQRRLLLVAEAVFASWWIARSAGPVSFWRAWLAIGVVIWLLSRRAGLGAMQGLALSATLYGGLAASGAPEAWQGAALVAVGACAGFVLAGSKASVPPACLVAAVAGSDLAGGRLLSLRLDGVDLACLAALLAPQVSSAVADRFRWRDDRMLTLLGALTTAAGLAAIVWALARGFAR